MRVAFLLPNNVAGGAERVLLSIANKMALDGDNVSLVLFDGNPQFYHIGEGIQVVDLGIDLNKEHGIQRYLSYAKYKRKLQLALSQVKPDIVISFLFITNLVALSTCKQLRIPIIISERNDPTRYPVFRKLLMKLTYRKANGFVCQSATIQMLMSNQYGIKESIVIPNPITQDQIGKKTTQKKHEIIAVGRLIPQKNFRMLISAFVQIGEEIPDYTLTIYGEGPLRKELEQQIRDAGYEERIKMPGIEKDAIKKHNDASIFILSSDFEGYPNVLAEAMANGLVCIATDVASGTVREMITNGLNGYIVPVNNEESMSKEILKVIRSSDLMCRVSKEATKITEQISIESVLKQWKDYVNTITNKNDPHRFEGEALN